jgi:hypothetical protein
MAIQMASDPPNEQTSDGETRALEWDNDWAEWLLGKYALSVSPIMKWMARLCARKGNITAELLKCAGVGE